MWASRPESIFTMVKRLPFCMLLIPDMMRALNKCDLFVTIDLTDVYFYIPFAVEHKRFCLFHIPSSGSPNSKTELLILHVEVLGLHRLHKESFVTRADSAVHRHETQLVCHASPFDKRQSCLNYECRQKIVSNHTPWMWQHCLYVHLQWGGGLVRDS